jgi:hypothetical protein
MMILLKGSDFFGAFFVYPVFTIHPINFDTSYFLFIFLYILMALLPSFRLKLPA